MLKKGHLIEVDIAAMAFGGRGIAKHDGMTLFVDGGVEGDRARIRITRKKKRYAEAVMETLLVPSVQRVSAPCRYAGYCGGCKWQGIAYRRQLDYKKQHVLESLEHIGKLADIRVHDTLPSPAVFAYRNKMEFSCTDRRWRLPHEMDQPPTDDGAAVGLHVPGTFYKVLDIENCLLQPEAGNAILEDVRAFMRRSDLPVYDLRRHTGFWRFVVLRHSSARDEWMVNIVTGFEQQNALAPLCSKLLQRHADIVSIVNNVTTRKAAVAVGEHETLLSGRAMIRDRIGPFAFNISANSFFQTNTAAAEILYGVVKDYADLNGGETVLDLYSGTGSIAVFLSPAAHDIVGIEQVPSAVQDAETNCRLNHIHNCRFIQGDIRRCLQGIAVRPSVVISDPPRAGMHPDVIAQIMHLAPGRIVYVSCNPASLARDVALLQPAYTLKKVQPVDMFPHTPHIEAVALLERG